MEKIKWHTEKRKLADLKDWERNPRQATAKQKEDLEKSLNRFDLADPLIINTDNTIIGGHFRKRILKEKGIEEVDVRIPSRKLTDKEVEELNLRLNKNLGEWNLDLLANFSEDLLKDVGFDDELDEIFGLDIADEFDVEKELEKVLAGKERRCKEGDLWQLGRHRLFIGDAVKKESWEKVLGNERFDLLETDPPYKLAYARNIRKYKVKEGFGYRRSRRYIGVDKRGGIANYNDWISIANEFQNPKGANIMIFENWRNTPELWQIMERYWKIKNMIIWHAIGRSQGFTITRCFFQKYDIALLGDKGKSVTNEDYEKELDKYLQEKGQKLIDSYEIILYRQKGKSYWDRPKGTKWAKVTDHISWTTETGKSSGQQIVFGTKPIQILVPYIKILSPRNGIVMDCFGGSGSTLIACEIMKRKCRMIEIEPVYGEVILARWEKFSGKIAKKF